MAKATKKKVTRSACPWSANNLSCTNTNGVLNGMDEISAKFSKAKNIKMSAFAFWSDIESPNQRALSAKAVAGRLDRLFRKLLGAKYEEGYNRSSSIIKMQSVLKTRDKTVCQLAVVVDKAYRFRGEV